MQPEAFYHLYAHRAAVPTPNPTSFYAKIAGRLATLCVTLGGERGELPLIRYQGASDTARGVGTALQRELNRFAKSPDARRVLQVSQRQIGCPRHGPPPPSLKSGAALRVRHQWHVLTGRDCCGGWCAGQR